jgi:hypothetical protein
MPAREEAPASEDARANMEAGKVPSSTTVTSPRQQAAAVTMDS